jgi:hypothetical protein
MTSMQDQNGKIYKLDYNQNDFYGSGSGPFPSDLNTINNDVKNNAYYLNNYNFVNRPYIISYHTQIDDKIKDRYKSQKETRGKYVIYEIKNDQDVENNTSNILTLSNNVESFQAVYHLTNQLLYDNNSQYITITTATGGQTIDLNGKYWDYTRENKNQNPDDNAYDINSGIIFSGYGISPNGTKVTNNNTYDGEIYHNTFKFWYSSVNKGWNFLSSTTFQGSKPLDYNINIVGAGQSFNNMTKGYEVTSLGNKLNVTFSEIKIDFFTLNYIYPSKWINIISSIRTDKLSIIHSDELYYETGFGEKYRGTISEINKTISLGDGFILSFPLSFTFDSTKNQLIIQNIGTFNRDI